MITILVVPPACLLDPVRIELKNALEELTGGTVNLHCTDLPYSFNSPADLVVLFDEALQWFHNNRMVIPGRYLAVGASFRFLDAHSYLQSVGNLQDANLSALICNCPALVRGIAGGLPTTFSYRPIAQRLKEILPSVLFVSVVDKVCDQDFSLAVRTSKLVGDSYRIYCQAADVNKLPAELVKHAYSFDVQDERECYAAGAAYIPTPRITDYRGAVIPVEYFKAARYSPRPLLIGHPLIAEAFKGRIDLLPSLKAFDYAVKEVIEGVQIKDKGEDLPSEVPSALEFATKLVTIWKRMSHAVA